MMAANNQRPTPPKPPLVPSPRAPAAGVLPTPQPYTAAAAPSPPMPPVAATPAATTDELAELRGKLARAEAKITELETAAKPAPNPFLRLPPPSEAAIAQSVPLVQLTPDTTAFVAARPGSISISPSGLVSIMPFDGAKRRRRQVVAVVATILLLVAGILGVTIFSRV